MENGHSEIDPMIRISQRYIKKYISFFMEIDFNQGKAYWESLSFESRIELLKEGDFFNGFANYIWEYLIMLVQIYVSRRAKEINYRYES